MNLEPLDGHALSSRKPFAQQPGHQERWLFELETALLEQGVKKNAQRPAADTGERARAPQPAVKQTAAQLPLRTDTGALNGNTLPAPALPGALPNGYTVYGVAVAAEAGALPRVAIPGTAASDTPGRTVDVMGPSDGDSGGVVRTQPLALSAGLNAGSAASSCKGQIPEAEAATETPSMPLTQLTQEYTPEYALRQIHLYRESGGVRAWIARRSLRVLHALHAGRRQHRVHHAFKRGVEAAVGHVVDPRGNRTVVTTGAATAAGHGRRADSDRHVGWRRPKSLAKPA